MKPKTVFACVVAILSPMISFSAEALITRFDISLPPSVPRQSSNSQMAFAVRARAAADAYFSHTIVLGLGYTILCPNLTGGAPLERKEAAYSAGSGVIATTVDLPPQPQIEDTYQIPWSTDPVCTWCYFSAKAITQELSSAVSITYKVETTGNGISITFPNGVTLEKSMATAQLRVCPDQESRCEAP